MTQENRAFDFVTTELSTQLAAIDQIRKRGLDPRGLEMWPALSRLAAVDSLRFKMVTDNTIEPTLDAMTRQDDGFSSSFVFVPDDYRQYAADMLERWRALRP